MKRIFWVLLFFCCLFSPSKSETMVNDNKNAAKEINLSGNLSTVKQRSLVQPIQAFITEQFIEIDFNASLGTIVLSMYDETGSAVYQQSVNTYAGQQLLIDITSFDAGQYSIEFINSQNEYFSGDFEI